LSFDGKSNVSAKLLKSLVGGATKAIPVIGQSQALAQLTKQGLSKVSIQATGYDFPNLLVKIGFYYLFSFVIIKYFEAVIFGSGIIKTLGGLAGINLNPALPDNVVKFFKDGITIRKADTTKNIPEITLMPWDLINLLAFILLAGEALSYFNNLKQEGKKYSWFTVGAWSLLIGGFSLIAVFPILSKIKGGQHMSAADFAAKFNVPITTNFAITILNPTNNQTQDFVMTAAQVVSLPSTFYVTKGPVVSALANNISDSMFTQLFGVPVVP